MDDEESKREAESEASRLIEMIGLDFIVHICKLNLLCAPRSNDDIFF